MFLSRVLQAYSCKDPSSLLSLASVQSLSPVAFGAVLQVTKKLPNRGLGTKLQRLKWKDDSFWTITAVKPSIVRAKLFCLNPLLPGNGHDQLVVMLRTVNMGLHLAY